jgi:DNA-binding MarR family transcriptional regulator
VAGNPDIAYNIKAPDSVLTTAETADADGELDKEIFDAMAALIGQILTLGEAISEQFGVPMFCVKALHILDASMPMKELGQRMRCDPSFVTAIADALEQRGLATREPNTSDRRVKNLVLSTEGHEVKRQMEKDLMGRMPWSRAFDTADRETFLGLLRKLTAADAGAGMREVSDALDTASSG